MGELRRGAQLCDLVSQYLTSLRVGAILGVPMIAPREDHYRICSPLQDRSWEEELAYKQQCARDVYGTVGLGRLLPQEIPIVADEAHMFGYRNKMEFSFVDLSDTPADQPSSTKSLAFFERGAKRRVPVDGCMLAQPAINDVARYILAWVNGQQIPMRSLKSLIVRSNGEGQVIAALFIKDSLSFSEYPLLSAQMLGFTLYYSTHKSPASVPTETLYHAGVDMLGASVLGTRLTFGLFSFFQINIPIFEQAVRTIGEYIEPGSDVLDYYAGVGAISLPLASRYAQATLVESNEEAVAHARAAIEAHSITHASAHATPSEKMRECITAQKSVIFDPPRSGLHPKIIAQVREQKPIRIIYLSCNLETQARDIKQFDDAYQLSFFSLFNFFPRALHVEGLAVLNRV